MNTLLLSYKNIFKDKLLSVLLSITLIIPVIYNLFRILQMSKYIISYGQQTDLVEEYIVLNDVNKFALYFAIIMLFVSYEVFYQIKGKSVEEVLKASKKGLSGTYRNLFFILLVHVFSFSILSFIVTFVGINRFIELTANFKWNIALSFFINYFLTSVLTVVVGFFASTLKNRLKGYTVITLFGIFISGILEYLSQVIYMSTSINIYPLTNLFSLSPPNLSYFLPQEYGLDVLPYRFFRIFFWIAFFVSIYYIFLSKNAYQRKGSIKKYISVLCCVLMICCYAMPTSKFDRSVGNPQECNLHDVEYYYYNEFGKREDYDTDYHITAYDMDFKIYNQLTAEVTAETDIPADGKKVFTLYHGYNIKKILDENGNKVPFLREGDFVYIDLINETHKITFIYRGHSPKFYSNYQGSLLLGGFCYYPMPGFLQVYQTKTYNTVFNIPKDDIEFDVTVHTTNTVYSNLNCNGKNSFSGKAQTVSLVSGMYYEQKTDGIRVLSAGTNSFFDDAELKKQYDIIQDKQVIKGKTIIIVPNVNETFDNVFSRDTVLMCGFATGIGDSVNNSVGNESSNLS